MSEWSQRFSRRAISLIGAAAIMAAALWGAGVTPPDWLVSRWKQSPAGGPVEQASNNDLPSSGAPPAAEQPGAPRSGDLAGTESSLAELPQPLYLVATEPGRHPREGIARIGTDPDEPQTYAAGALLANGARLDEIHREFVVLSRNGASAKLHLYQRDPRLAHSLPVSDPLLHVGGESAEPVVATKVADGLTDYIRPSPMYEGTVLRGYQVYPGRKAGVFARLGLEPGDVIVALNDAPLLEPSQALEMLGVLMQGMAAVATIERKGLMQRIALDGSLITAEKDNERNAALQAPPTPGVPGS